MKYLIAIVVVLFLGIIGIAYVGYHAVNTAIDNFTIPNGFQGDK